MHTTPSRLEDANHALFDAGLLNAAQATWEHLKNLAMRHDEISPERQGAIGAFQVPWWIETKHETPWTLQHYQNITADRLKDVVGKQHASALDVRRNDIQRLLAHLSYHLIRNAMYLHTKRINNETGAPFSADDLLCRMREELKRVHVCRYMETDCEAHPLWHRGRDTQLTYKRRRIIDATQHQIAAARYLIGNDINQTIPTGPAADAVREALPMLLTVDASHVLQLSLLHRRAMQNLLRAPSMNPALKTNLVSNVVDIWSQINASTAEEMQQLQEQGKSDVLFDDSRRVLTEYVLPHTSPPNPDELQRVLPILSYHTLILVDIGNEHDVQFVINLWEIVIKTLPHVPRRITNIAMLACRIALMQNEESTQELRRLV